jgi:VanZ family protein
MSTNTLPHRWWLPWIPALLVMAAIFFFSSLPSNDIPNFGSFDFSVKKLGHMLGYALLALAYLYGLRTQFHSRSRLFLLFAWLLTIAYAFTDEFHQSFTPGRNSTIIDVGIDSIGSLIGLLPVIIKR